MGFPALPWASACRSDAEPGTAETPRCGSDRPCASLGVLVDPTPSQVQPKLQDEFLLQLDLEQVQGLLWASLELQLQLQLKLELGAKA